MNLAQNSVVFNGDTINQSSCNILQEQYNEFGSKDFLELNVPNLEARATFSKYSGVSEPVKRQFKILIVDDNVFNIMSLEVKQNFSETGVLMPAGSPSPGCPCPKTQTKRPPWLIFIAHAYSVVLCKKNFWSCSWTIPLCQRPYLWAATALIPRPSCSNCG